MSNYVETTQPIKTTINNTPQPPTINQSVKPSGFNESKRPKIPRLFISNGCMLESFFFSEGGSKLHMFFFFSHLQYVTNTCQVSFPTKQSDVLQQRSLHLSQPKTQLTWGWFKKKKRSQKLLHPPFSWGSFFSSCFFFILLPRCFHGALHESLLGFDWQIGGRFSMIFVGWVRAGLGGVTWMNHREGPPHSTSFPSWCEDLKEVKKSKNGWDDHHQQQGCLNKTDPPNREVVETCGWWFNDKTILECCFKNATWRIKYRS